MRTAAVGSSSMICGTRSTPLVARHVHIEQDPGDLLPLDDAERLIAGGGDGNLDSPTAPGTS